MIPSATRGDAAATFDPRVRAARGDRRRPRESGRRCTLGLAVALVLALPRVDAWLKTRSRRRKKVVKAADASSGGASSARDEARRARDARNAGRRDAAARRDEAARRRRAEAEDARREAKLMRADETRCRRAWTMRRREAAATTCGRVCRAAVARRVVKARRRFLKVEAAAVVVQKAWRFPGPAGRCRAARNARAAAAGGADAAGLAARRAAAAASRAKAALRNWPAQIAAKAWLEGRFWAAADIQRRYRGVNARRRAGSLRSAAALARGLAAVALWQRAFRNRRGAYEGASRRKRAAAAFASEHLLADARREGIRRRKAEEARQRKKDAARVSRQARHVILEDKKRAQTAAKNAAAALWEALVASGAAAAVEVRSARGPRADRVNGLFRADRAAADPPSFSRDFGGAFLFVARDDDATNGLPVWVIGDERAKDGREKRALTERGSLDESRFRRDETTPRTVSRPAACRPRPSRHDDAATI